MIRINLLPSTARKKKTKPMPAYLFGAVAALLGSILIFVGVSYYFNGQITEKNARIAANTAKLKELEAKIKEVKDFEALNKKFMDRKKVIEELTANQSLPVRILDEMAMRLTEGVWLTSMSLANNKINVQGIGFSNSDIVNFIQSLKSSALFTDVVLQGTQRQEQQGVETYTFNIVFTVNPAGAAVPAGG